MRKVRLYIGDQLVDLPEEVSLPITYTTEDFKNPTIVKNSFSKTISLPNTETNNKIFNHFYKLDRFQLSGSFNPSQRVDFKIYCDSDLFESGYVQLNSISGIGEDKKYNITLYGGLGDFFYGLKYNEDGTTKTLADLQFFATDDTGVIRPKDDELTFNINKEFVSECFDKDGTSGGNTVKDIITFIPANNGLYEDFDNGHCLIAADGTIFPTSTTDSDITYTTKDGFALAALEKDYTEWQMRDLRSYKQRPAIKVSKLIETICREENSGYKVNFDGSFFSKRNPYGDKSFIALPLLGSEAEGAIEHKSTLTESSSFPFYVGVKDNTGTQEQFAQYIPNTYFDVTGKYIDLSDLPELAELNVDFDLQIRLHPERTDVNEGFPASYWRVSFGDFITGTSFTAQLLLIDEEGNTVGYSNLYNFTNDPLPNNPRYEAPNPEKGDSYVPIVPEASVTNVYGSYKKVNDQYYWYSQSGGNTTRLTISNWIRKADKVKLGLSISCQATFRADQGIFATGIGYLFDTTSYNKNATGATDFPENSTTYAGYEPLYDPNTSVITVKWENQIISDTPITKDMLLKTEASPADYLLSYSKLFGLYFVKDVDTKTITVYNRNSFFQNEVEDGTDKIDYSKDITITPLLFDRKWYLMSLETPETYFAKKYNTEYDLTYGQQRMNTGYNFNSEVTELYADNIFENIVSATDSDKYFRNFYSSDGTQVPAFLNDNITYSLYNGDESFETDIYGYYNIDPSKTQDWNVTSGADLFAKPCFFTLDGDEKSIEEITNALVLYNGHKDLVDYRGGEVPFWITDDLTYMATLNEKTPCYLWTNSETFNDEQIAIKKTNLPQFISYIVDSNNNVTDSLDFGLPREIYIDRINYDENQTLYANFGRAFYDDQFDVNTKKVTCYVKLDRAKQDLLRKFYYFDNAIWILNKIDSYDVTSYGTTRCEFIKVQDMNNYIAGVTDYSIGWRINKTEFGYLDTVAYMDVDSVASGYTGWADPALGLGVTSGGAGVTTVTAAIGGNTTYGLRKFLWSTVMPKYSMQYTNYIIQTPNLENSVKISGNIYTRYDDIVLTAYIIDEDTTVPSVIEDNKYILYTKKGSAFRLEISQNGTTMFSETYTGVNEDTVINLNYGGDPYIRSSFDVIEVPYDTLSVPVEIVSNERGSYIDGTSSCTMNPKEGDVGTTTAYIQPYEVNNRTNVTVCLVVLSTIKSDVYKNIRVLQMPNGMVILTLNFETDEIVHNVKCYNDNFDNYQYDSTNGVYKICVKPDEDFTLEVLNDDNATIYTETLNISANTTKTITI